MKVVVCFGAVRVLVPVGAGELPVRELVREATRRYNKATGQGPERWVGVRALRGSSGGILDPDDRVCDVADDRETLAAECAGPLLRPSRTPPPARARGGDGASGSSAGTASPDMFRGGGGVEVGGSERCVEVGASELEEGGGGLQVRRGSEPSLHQDTLPSGPQMSGQTKRWSAAVVCREEARLTQRARPPPEPPVHPGAAASPAHHQPFQRHHNRLSMQFSGPGSGGGAWLDAADRALPPPATLGTKSLPRDTRKEPLGRDTAAERDHRAEEVVRWVSGVQIAAGAEGGRQQLRVSLVKGERGLGFTITTRDNPTAGHPPIYIKNILPKGAAVADGRLRAGDRLVSVNSLSVAGLAQAQVVTLLRNTPTHSTVHLLVERAHTPQRSECAVQEDSGGVRWTEKAVGSPEERTVAEERGGGGGGGGGGRSDRLVLRLEVPVHDSEKAGLGISVKGKVTVGPAPHDLGIFIKSVLHGGAASRDGRLHTNDQLLCVNGVSLAGQSNARAMDTLRRALLHSRPPPSPAASPAARVISLTVARRTESTESLERWKDDTPPSGHESSSNTTHDHNTTVVYNDNNSGSTPGSPSPADIRNNNHNKPPYASVIHITNNNNSSWTSNQSDDSKGGGGREEVDKKRDSFEWSRLEGWNPVIDRLTGLRNESYYIATQAQHPQLPRHRQHVILEEDAYSRVTGAGGVCESGSESAGETAFTRDAIGRRSMSEKRHATVDAKTTGTYRKIKELKAINAEAGAVGPALGMRKSSSLESLQTAVQEQQRQRTGEPLYAPHAQRTRRAPLHPPLKHWLTDEGCAGAGEGVGVTRGSPQQSSLSHKKPSVLRSLASMLRLSRPARRAEEAYVRTQPGRASDKTMSHEPAPDPGPQVPPDRRPHYTYRGGGEREPGEPLYGAPPHRAAPPAGAWPPAGHYANYQQIQHNLSARREKLSEVQIGQMRRQVAVQRARALDDDTRRAGAGGGFHSQRSCREGGGGGAGARPQSNYYEYESIQRHQQQQQHRGHR